MSWHRGRSSNKKWNTKTPRARRSTNTRQSPRRLSAGWTAVKNKKLYWSLHYVIWSDRSSNSSKSRSRNCRRCTSWKSKTSTSETKSRLVSRRLKWRLKTVKRVLLSASKTSTKSFSRMFSRSTVTCDHQEVRLLARVQEGVETRKAHLGPALEERI